MASSKLSALDALTTPADEDLIYIVDDPSGTATSKKITRENFLANTRLQWLRISAATTTFSPADSTTYAFGNQPGTNPTAGTDGIYFLIMPRSGTVKRVYGLVLTAGTLSSADSATIRVKNVTTTTTENVSTSVQQTALSVPFSNASMSLAFSAGDALCMQYITPAWTTNPTVVIFNLTVEVEYDE